jgi:hypothetical protein
MRPTFRIGMPDRPFQDAQRGGARFDPLLDLCALTGAEMRPHPEAARRIGRITPGHAPAPVAR